MPKLTSSQINQSGKTGWVLNPRLLIYDVMVATVATSDCFVRPAASQVFLPIWIAEDKPRASQDRMSCLPRSPRSTDQNETNQRAVAHLGGWENSYFERCSFLPTLSGP